MAKITAKLNDKNLRKNLRDFSDTMNRRVGALMEYNAAYTTGWLKQNAPWHDNTGAARSGLVAVATSSNRSHEILMAYSVYYGIWLEVAHSGQWAVITPAMRIVGQKVMADMQALINATTRGV